jgi:hypothetical protein
LDKMRTQNASGNSNRLWMSAAMKGQIAARPTAEHTAVARRASLLRSISGPSSGDTTANGARVNSR